MERKKEKVTLRFPKGSFDRMCDRTGVDNLVAHKMLVWLPESEKPVAPAWGKWVVTHTGLGLRVTPLQLETKSQAIQWAVESASVIPWALAPEWTSAQKARYRSMATRIWASILDRFPAGGPTSDETTPSSESVST